MQEGLASTSKVCLHTLGYAPSYELISWGKFGAILSLNHANPCLFYAPA